MRGMAHLLMDRAQHGGGDLYDIADGNPEVH